MRNTNLNARNNANVAHNWAHNTGNVTNGSNFYYDNEGIIYSFGQHFPIARRITHKLFYYTLQTWSGSYTSRHKNHVHSAIPNDALIVYMRYIPTGVSSDINHEANIMYWLGELTTARNDYNDARKKTKHINRINGIINQIDNYKIHFNTDPCVIVPALLDIYAWYTGIDIQSILASEAIVDKARNDKREAKELRLKTEAVAMFHNFEIATLPYGYGNATLLRYNKKTENVETSKGIRIPVAIAMRLYASIQSKLNIGGCEGCNLLVFGNYTIDTVSDSHIVAGCHNIRMTEVQACYDAIPKLLSNA